MKICFLADVRSSHTKRWIEFFSYQHDVSLITLAYPPHEMEKVCIDEYIKLGIKLFIIPRSFPGILLNTMRIKKIIRNIQPDVVHAHFVTHYGYWGARSGFHPLVISGWGDDVLIHINNFILSFFVKYSLCSADAITVDGENSFQTIMNNGIPSEKITLITHGVDTIRFSPNLKDKKYFEEIFKNSWPVVACIRGFDPVYDPETIVRAIPYVIKKMPSVNFLIVGSDGVEKDRIRELAKHLNVIGNIHFYNWVPHHQMPRLLASSDIYVSTSLSDGGVAVSTFEAMACGIPVVVTDVGDNKLWIKNNENGFIIPIKSPEYLANRIICLLSDTNLRERCGRVNRMLVEQKQDYYKEMEKVHNMYNNLVNEVTE